MDVTGRSTSPLMKQIFGKDLEIIVNDYNACISGLAEQYPYLKDIFSDCVNRTGFLFPYMSAEYGYHSIKGCFMPHHMKKIVTGFGLIGLAVSIDDDIADEYASDHLKTVCNISVSELIQNLGYGIVLSHSGFAESGIVLAEINEALSSTVRYQCADASNISNFQKRGFDLEEYLHAAKKTVCPVKHGLRLGMSLASGQKFISTADAIGERLGIILQLIDDMVDLNDDIKNYKGIVTFPMFLLHNGESFDKIFGIIDYSINECLIAVKKFPFSYKIEQMIEGFEKIAQTGRERLCRNMRGSERRKKSLYNHVQAE